MKERLQKLLAQANLGSRRASEDLITKGRVRVNGVTAQLGDKADPNTDVIEVDGSRLKFDAQPHIYIMLNKPKQVLTTDKPHRGDRRETVADLIGRHEHLFSIGRLDADSEGMIVMTNDGDLSQKLSHPRYRHSKTYRVEVLGLPVAETLERWQEGIFLEDGKTAPCIVEITKGSVRGTTLRVIMTEGKKRQIRRIAAALGHPVQRLVRTHIGMMPLGDLEPGKWRELNAKEVVALSTPVPEIKTLRGKQHRSAPVREVAPETEAGQEKPRSRRVTQQPVSDETQEKPRSRRITLSPSADETVEKRRTARRGVEVHSYEETANRRPPRAKTSSEEEPAEKRRSPRSRSFDSSEEAPEPRRSPRRRTSSSPEKNVGKRRAPRPATSDDAPETRAAAAEEAPKKRPVRRMKRPADLGRPAPRVSADETSSPSRRIARTKPADSAQDERPTKRRTSRVKPSTFRDDDKPAKRPASRTRPAASSSDEATKPKRRTTRVKPAASSDQAQDKRRKPRKNDTHDDKWGKPSPASRDRKPRRKKDSPR